MVSNFDTVALHPVPVHPSSSSPTDERWKQIWGSRVLFCRLGDLSESSRARVSPHPSPADVSQAPFHPLGIPPAHLHLPLFIMQICILLFSSLPDLRVYLIPYLSPMLLLFICLQNECIYALDKLWKTEGINHCHLAAQHVSCRRSRLPILLLLSLTFMHFQLLRYINLRDGGRVREEGGVLDEDKYFCASAIWVKYMFTHSQLRNPGAQCQISYSGCPGSAAHPPPQPSSLWQTSATVI